jgi:large subunit ribosomal protein L30
MIVVAIVAVAAAPTADRRKKIMATLRIKYIRSAIGFPQDQKDTIRALGFRKLQHVVEHEDHPAIRGMIRKVTHLVQVEEAVSETL